MTASDAAFLGSIALGVAIAIAWPTLFQAVRKEFPAEQGRWPSWVKPTVRKYGLLFIVSVFGAVVVAALYHQKSATNPGFWTALLLGVGFESTLEKAIFPKSSNRRHIPGESAPKNVSPPDGTTE